jgi:flagellar protein FlbD
MIEVTRLNGQNVVVNAELIATVEAMPDTLITITNGHQIIVKESVGEVIERAVAYRRRVLSALFGG